MKEPSHNGSDDSGWRQAMPIVQIFADRRGASLRGDVIGGISACIVMIPSVVAYADLAGLPPAHWPYAALAGMLGYAAFASSRQVIAGPDAAITLLVASVVGPLAGGDPARTAVLCAATARRARTSPEGGWGRRDGITRECIARRRPRPEGEAGDLSRDRTRAAGFAGAR